MICSMMVCSRIEDDVFGVKSGSFHECQRLVSWLKGFRKPEFVGDHLYWRSTAVFLLLSFQLQVMTSRMCVGRWSRVPARSAAAAPLLQQSAVRFNWCFFMDAESWGQAQNPVGRMTLSKTPCGSRCRSDECFVASGNLTDRLEIVRMWGWGRQPAVMPLLNSNQQRCRSLRS